MFLLSGKYADNSVKPCRYPCANGYQAWSIDEASFATFAEKDLLWRMTASDNAMLYHVLECHFPNIRKQGDEVRLGNGFSVSARSESRGGYGMVSRPACLLPLKGNEGDTEKIRKAFKFCTSEGYYPGPLFQQLLGFQPENVVRNISRRCNIPLLLRKRYLFNEKPCHYRFPILPKEKKRVLDAIQKFPPVNWGFKPVHLFWYVAENGTIDFGVVYFRNAAGEMVKMPITAWKSTLLAYSPVVFDTLHPAPLYPLFDLNTIVQQRHAVKSVLICPDEFAVEYIKTNHRWITLRMPVTTYSDIEGSDWGVLSPLAPRILPKNTAEGCREALTLFNKLNEYGFNPRFLKIRKQIVKGWEGIDEDILPQLAKNQTFSLEEFALFAQSEYGVEPPEGILPKGQSLLDMTEITNEPELLLADLLNFGDLMMIFAWRGIGKSLLGFILALCFASGTKAYNDRICPTRKYKVLVIDGEMSAHSLRQRALALCRGLGLPESAVGDVRVRSSIVEGKDLQLDTDAGWQDLVADMTRAEIIIIDSLFKIFPTTMSPDFTATKPLNAFCSWCRQHGKTAIVIDHQGKSGTTAFGSMGKDIGLDAVLHLKTVDKMKQAVISKNRNFPSDSGCWLRFNIKSDDQGNSISFEVTEPATSGIAWSSKKPAPPEGVANNCHVTTPAMELDEIIITYIQEHPEQTQGAIVDKLNQKGLGCRSKLQARIKVLRESDQLPFWENAPQRGQTASPDSLEGEGEQ